MNTTDINAPSVLHVQVPATASSPAFSATAMLDRDRWQYYAATISMEHMSVRLTSAQVASVPIQRTMAPVLRTLLAESNRALLAAHPIAEKWAGGKPQRAPRRALAESPDRASLEGAALAYLLARLAGEASVKATARAAGIGRDDAARWLHLARKAGILTAPGTVSQ